MVPQNVTETIMREQLKAWGHRVEFGCELRHFAQTPRTVTAYVAGPAGEEVIIAHYLIGADGGGSFVRKKLGVSFPGRTLGIHALVADASLSGLNRDVWHHFNDGDMARMITICPLAGTQLFQIRRCWPRTTRRISQPTCSRLFLLNESGGRMFASIRFPGIEVPDECAHSGTLPCG